MKRLIKTLNQKAVIEEARKQKYKDLERLQDKYFNQLNTKVINNFQKMFELLDILYIGDVNTVDLIMCEINSTNTPSLKNLGCRIGVSKKNLPYEREFLCSEYFTIYFPGLKSNRQLLVTQFPEELENVKYSTILVKKGELISKSCSPDVTYEQLDILNDAFKNGLLKDFEDILITIAENSYVEDKEKLIKLRSAIKKIKRTFDK